MLLNSNMIDDIVQQTRRMKQVLYDSINSFTNIKSKLNNSIIVTSDNAYGLLRLPIIVRNEI